MKNPISVRFTEKGFGLDEDRLDLSFITSDYYDTRDMSVAIRARVQDEATGL